jgi:hypothetical protein
MLDVVRFIVAANLIRVLSILGKYCTTELYLQPQQFFFFKGKNRQVPREVIHQESQPGFMPQKPSDQV